MALLDARDAASLHAGVTARWPVLRRHGLAASRVLLLGEGAKPQRWLYVLLDVAQQGASQSCVPVVLSRRAFGFMPRLVQKYRGGL